MTSPAAIDGYAKAAAALSANATEHSFRTPLEILLSGLAKGMHPQAEKLTVLQEPPREKDIGAPDFLITGKSGAPVGCVECKKPGENLESLIGGKQLKKYETLTPNILLTDYWRFYLLNGGEIAMRAELSKKPTAAQKQKTEELLRRFLDAETQTIGDARKLAAALAARCAPLRGSLAEKLPGDESALNGLFESFRDTVYRGLTHEEFADALAQTLAYGLLFAKLKAPDGKILDLYTAEQYIPQNFALIREITGFMKKLDESGYAEVKYLVNNILAAVNAVDTAAVAESMQYKKTGGNDEDDPFLNFYEFFLAEYDAKLRKARGVYYTPPPVVRFIVRAADDVLRRDFGLKDGLGNSNITALDFAAGTGTFMLEMFRQVFNGKAQAKRGALAREHLLKNFFGFEYLIAPYVIAHLKLSYFLADMGAELKFPARIPVYLTNTLDKISQQINLSLLPALTKEANQAQEIKDKKILVITGNPPYSGHSQNHGEFINQLLHGNDTSVAKKPKACENYYEADGASLNEKNLKWLQDDYVKFIRFAQWKMEQADEGIIAVITNHAFLDNPTFRGMRQSLLNTFNHLYFLDLHGNSKKQERAPGGGKDENVFDIQQGVSISIFVKKPRLSKGIYHANFWGTRKRKYKQCAAENIGSIKWKTIDPCIKFCDKPFYLFIPINKKLAKEYSNFLSIPDIFPVNSVGIITARDDFTLAFDKKQLQKRLKQFVEMPVEDARTNFNLRKDARDWKITFAQKDLLESKLDKNNFCQIAYRPFDIRETYYTGNSRGFHCKPRDRIMRHMLAGKNLGLITSRRQSYQGHWNNAFITNIINEGHFRTDVNYLFPLYYNGTAMENGMPHENINPKFRKWLDEKYGKKYPPETILGYIYAKLHSPEYRKKYAEFLRLDFPRIPFPKEKKEFERLAKIGGALIKSHLLQNESGKTALRGKSENITVEEVEYNEKDKRLYINNDGYFSPVSAEVFNFQIGGYRPLEKFLKSRIERKLTLAEIQTMEKTAAAVEFTIKKMREIDG